ncbi:hypothetical protein ACFW6V_35440 [Streptomyces sp. NPDC058734]|uniref:hypothetical protein n=1 Tax=Streptomyces sp. NPDC058734 TaxID=3346615 RepID=UPI0036C5EE92
MHGFLTAGPAQPDAIARLLACIFRIPLESVDVYADGEMEERNWDAQVTCERAVFQSGDCQAQLVVYVDDDLPVQLSEADLAAQLAQTLNTPVLISWGTLPWMYEVVTAEGDRTFARVEGLEEGQDGVRVYATQEPVAAFPQATVEWFPEAVRDLATPTPVADELFPEADRRSPAGEVRALVRLWERLLSRMASGWPPSRWYGADMYSEDLENRDRLGLAAEALTAEDRAAALAAMEALDTRFRAQTVDDAGAALAVALGKAEEDFRTPQWYWRRRPPALPW